MFKEQGRGTGRSRCASVPKGGGGGDVRGAPPLDRRSLARLRLMVRASKKGENRALSAAGAKRRKDRPEDGTAVIVRRITRTLADARAASTRGQGMDARVRSIKRVMDAALAKRRASGP